MSKQRLDKVLSNLGLGTRKEIKEYVKRGLVKINGQTATDAGSHVQPDADEIFFKDEIVMYKKYIYLMMNKPAGVITATEDNFQRTVFDILPDFYKQFTLSAAGRLDKDTEGLLILTNDGQKIHELISPKKHVDKVYYVRLKEDVQPEYAARCEEGIDIGGYVTMPAMLSEVKEGVLLTIQEGKFHQVKRMFEVLGNEVVYLKRVSISKLKLDENLSPGEVRELTKEEVNLLYE